MKKKIIALHEKLAENNFIIPEEWKDIIDILEALLIVAKWFFNDDIDKIIDDILRAIKEFKLSRP